jgi:hypothetical protein
VILQPGAKHPRGCWCAGVHQDHIHLISRTQTCLLHYLVLSAVMQGRKQSAVWHGGGCRNILGHNPAWQHLLQTDPTGWQYLVGWADANVMQQRC